MLTFRRRFCYIKNDRVSRGAGFTGNHTITMIAGYEGIFCGLSAIYSAMGQIVNAEYGKTIIPLG